MRIWHYKLIPFLPKSQLLAQWRELNSIFKKQDKHILINYIYEYPKDDLFTYSNFIINEMKKRGFEIKSIDNYYKYFMYQPVNLVKIPFINHHNFRYMQQCFYNLQEKYDRGQKDFDYNTYWKLERFIQGETNEEV